VSPSAATSRVVRFEVRSKPGVLDPRARSLLARARALGYAVERVETAKVYLAEADFTPHHRRLIAEQLLADPVVEEVGEGAGAARGGPVVELHPLPGVMDPVAQSVREAIRALAGVDAEVSTGTRYDMAGVSQAEARQIIERLVANKVIHRIADEPVLPAELPKGRPYRFEQVSVALRGKGDADLAALSREAHLFLSVEELRAVRDHFESLGRDPTDIELETIAQTWSEHCVHKTLKSTVRYRHVGPDAIPWAGRPGHSVADDGTVTITNLLRSTVAAATHALIEDGVDWTLSIFKDNSGVVALDDAWGVNIKVETHNRPSAIEPYGGAATGAGGCIRDVIGTGLGAKPIACTDVFCVADPRRWSEQTGRSGDGLPLPPGVLHSRRVLTDVVAGVRDYGNRMGIPTLSGAVAFDDRYVGNPLVFCGCVGLIPRDLVRGQARAGDRIVALGGRTGRDGIHGATFSSAQIEQGHSDEFAHAVQIGNAIEEKRLLDAILRARDAAGGPLFSAITDCGAGGFSSAVGEMARDLGAEVHLDRAPLKYAGLSHTEVWISEAQERMVLAVPPDRVAALRAICEEEGVEVADLGEFGTPGRVLELHSHGERVGSLDMEFLHEGLPMPTREATWATRPASRPKGPPQADPSVPDALMALLSHPDIASKHWIIRQYDHEVQGNTVVKPLVGPAGRGPSDAAVIEPRPGTGRGVALACGLATAVGDPGVGGDAYQAALAAIDECVRNLVCAGADPSRTAILDNFCWPSCDKPENMGALVRACAGCYDGALAYRTPFVSGKDSLNNQLRYEDPATGQAKVIEIPCTLLITGLGLVRNIQRCVTMDAKRPGNLLVLVGRTEAGMGGSHFQALYPSCRLLGDEGARAVPGTDLRLGPAAARAVAQAIADGLVASAHDCSEGGVLCAVAEMLIATTGPAPGATPGGASALSDLLADRGDRPRPLGAALTMESDLLDRLQLGFSQTPSRYVLEIRSEDLPKLRTVLRDHGGVWAQPIGTLDDSGTLTWAQADLRADVNALADAWLAPLDW
jgi:phosphoribosylformylglycinamidine synthase subunit PurSL